MAEDARDTRGAGITQNPSLLRKLREDLGMTLRQVASHLGISPTTVHNFESDGFPNGETLRGLADLLKSSPNAIVGWDYGAPTPKEVFRFYSSIAQFQIHELTKEITVRLDGDAFIKQRVEQLTNQTQRLLRFEHRVLFGERNKEALDLLRDGAAFNWLEAPGGVDRMPPVQLKTIDYSSLNRGYFDPSFPMSEQPYSYELSYNCSRAFRMSVEQTVEAPDSEKHLEEPRQYVEWTQFFVEKPIERLVLEVEFPPNYYPRDLRREVWKGDFLYSMKLEGFSKILALPDHVEQIEHDTARNRHRLVVNHPVFGLSYGLVWTPLASRDLEDIAKFRNLSPRDAA